MKETEELREAYEILKEARFARKGDYRTYERYKDRIKDIGLSWAEYDNVIRQLSKILKI